MTGGFEFGDDASDDSRGSPSDSSPVRGETDADERGAVDAPDDRGGVGGETTDEPAGADSRGEVRPAGEDPELATLLYDGERVEATVDVDDGRLVCTTHRLLVHTPEADGRTLAVVQRPNVEGLDITTAGSGAYVTPALKAILAGGVLAGAGAVVPVDGMAGAAPSASGAGATGMGGTVALLGRLLTYVALVDDLLRLLGALAMLVGVLLLGLYLHSRRREVVVSVAGDEDLRVPGADVTAEDVARLVPDG